MTDTSTSPAQGSSPKAENLSPAGLKPDCTNPVYLELRRIYCCAGAEFSRPTLEKGWKEIERLEARVRELETQLEQGKSQAPTVVPRPIAIWMLDHWRRNGLPDKWLIDHLLGLAPPPRSMQLRYDVVHKARDAGKTPPKPRTFSTKEPYPNMHTVCTSCGKSYAQHIALSSEGVIDACDAPGTGPLPETA